MTHQNPIEIVIADAGPLISLAHADALNILLVFKDDVRLVITDFVDFEVTRNRDRFPDAQKIFEFLNRHAEAIRIEETLYGSTMKNMVLQRQRYDEDANFRNIMDQLNSAPPVPPPDIGEHSIISYVKKLINTPPGTPVLILAEDDFFLHSGSGAGIPGNAHILSTRAFLDTLCSLGLVPSANEIWNDIQRVRPDVNQADVDRSAKKIDTDWISAIDHKKTAAIEKQRTSRKDRRLSY